MPSTASAHVRHEEEGESLKVQKAYVVLFFDVLGYIILSIIATLLAIFFRQLRIDTVTVKKQPFKFNDKVGKVNDEIEYIHDLTSSGVGIPIVLYIFTGLFLYVLYLGLQKKSLAKLVTWLVFHVYLVAVLLSYGITTIAIHGFSESTFFKLVVLTSLICLRVLALNTVLNAIDEFYNEKLEKIQEKILQGRNNGLLGSVRTQMMRGNLSGHGGRGRRHGSAVEDEEEDIV